MSPNWSPIPQKATPVDVVEAEAIGAPSVTATWRDVEWVLPTDLDGWPLPVIGDTVRFTEDGCLTIHHPTLLLALQLLLGDQWPGFVATATKRRDLAEASHVFAAAAGVTRNAADPIQLVFGGLPRLLFDLTVWPQAVEATLQTLGLDYADRFRRDDIGRRRLTLRRIHVNLSHAAYDCPLAIARYDGKRPLSDTALAVMDLFEAATGKPHPSRPLNPQQVAQRRTTEQQIAEYKQRRGHRGIAVETAQKNAQLQ